MLDDLLRRSLAPKKLNATFHDNGMPHGVSGQAKFDLSRLALWVHRTAGRRSIRALSSQTSLPTVLSARPRYTVASRPEIQTLRGTRSRRYSEDLSTLVRLLFLCLQSRGGVLRPRRLLHRYSRFRWGRGSEVVRQNSAHGRDQSVQFVEPSSAYPWWNADRGHTIPGLRLQMTPL